MSPFEFATAQRIVFGRNTLDVIEELAGAIGQKTLIVSGASQRYVPELQEKLSTLEISSSCFTVAEEPSISRVTEGCGEMEDESCHSVISIGGGSAIDAGKAIAALAANPGDPLDYLEVIGRGAPMPRSPFPFIAIPTTAGTGAEVTKNAVLSSSEHKVKVSLRSAAMLPTASIIDPSLTASLPRQATANAGLDALTQVIEPFLSSRANPMTDALCRAAIPRAAQALRSLAASLDNPSAREDLAYAALSSGLALANAGLGAVHGFAGPLGGMFPAPHGAVCARLLPIVLRTNLRAIQERAPEQQALKRFTELGYLLTGHQDASAEDGIKAAEQLASEFSIRPLSNYGIRSSDIPQLVKQSQKASSMKGNPIVLDELELANILESAL